MINQVFHKNQRVAQGQDTANKWLVFTSELAQTTSYRSTVSPFRLMLEEIVWIGSCRSVGLMIMLFLSRTFREEISAVDDRGLAFQCDLISSGDYGKVSHVIDLARDITQMNGTISEQVQVILYTKALFLYHASTSVKVRVTEFSSVFKEIWGWVDAAWQNMNVPNGKRKKLEQDQCDVVLAGFSLLHLIISHPVLLIEDVVRFTTFLSSDNDESRNVLQEVVNWIINLPIGSNQPSSVLIESGVMLLVNSIRSRSYDDVAIATIDACVGIQVLLELLEIQYPLEANAIVTVYTGDKQQIWSMLLYFDSRVVTSRILDLDFLDTAIFSRLLSLNANAHSPEAMIASLNQRLEAVMYLEVLVCAASRRGTSVNTRMLFGETCKLLLHHDIIAKETTYLQKTDLSYKHVAVCKRVMQLICCLCIDFSSRSTSRMFVAQLEAVGIPQWVVAFHQAQHTEQVPSSSDQLLTRVDLFWKDWQGREAVENSTHKLKKTLVQTAPNRQRSVFEKAANHRIQVKPNVLQLDSDEDLLVAKAKKPTASNSPVKRQDTTRNLPKLRQGGSRTRATSASIVETLLSIDAESALRLAKKKHEQQQPKVEIEEDVLDSDANSALTGSSEEEIKQKRQRAPHKSRTRLNHEEEKKMSQAKQLEHKTEQNNTRSHESRSSNSDSENSLSAASRRDRARSKAKTSHKAPDKRSKVARNQPHEALLGVFRKYDVDGDGVISFIDLRRAMDRQTKGHRLSDVEIQRWITEKDKGGQGVVSFEDFVVAFQGKLQHT
ncbi:putative calcium-binding protein CML16 [Phytophthora citrophthora]|uniref:Calcium-binding protein CML16 n=1 Tax=Phytophthora citrophthora TaxID=4793 RepID=A0AAD9G5V4_9STRA|nr:putative calcium-binding protein CML16 [Phytophthora citrophthora]